MDDFQTRAVKNLRERHEYVIQENAERIREHIGYVLARVEKGQPGSVGLYAQDIATSVQRILGSVTALETAKEITDVMATSDEPVTTKEA
jgi:hypothetical protein